MSETIYREGKTFDDGEQVDLQASDLPPMPKWLASYAQRRGEVKPLEVAEPIAVSAPTPESVAPLSDLELARTTTSLTIYNRERRLLEEEAAQERMAA